MLESPLRDLPQQPLKISVGHSQMVIRSGTPGTRNDDRMGTINSRSILRSDKSLFAYSQPINLGSQVVSSGIRTQITDNQLNPDTFLPKRLWNPINNRINLIDAEVNDYIDIDIIISAVPVGSIFQASIDLDYSPALDGSLVITPPITRILVIGGVIPPQSLHYSFKFVVTAPMKENGIGIMVRPFGLYTLVDTRLMIERLTAPT